MIEEIEIAKGLKYIDTFSCDSLLHTRQENTRSRESGLKNGPLFYRKILQQKGKD